MMKNIFRDNQTIAVVGLSDKPDRESFVVAKYLQDQGYRIVPVNPNVKEVLGETSYARLEDIPFKIDIVDIFRRPENVPEIVDSAVRIGARVVWMQEGIVHAAAAGKAEDAGITVVMDKCMMKEHRKIL